MKLITPVQLPEAGLELRPSSRCMAMGSCFAEHVGSLMAESGLQTDVNPFGVLYNPESIRTSLSILMYGQYDEKHIFKGRDGLWHSWMHSGAFSAASKEEVKKKIWERLQGSAANLKTTDLLLITFGTNRAYRLRDNELSDDEKKNVVANCHKEPASRFEEIELRHDEIAESWLKTLELLPSHTRVVFTKANWLKPPCCLPSTTFAAAIKMPHTFRPMRLSSTNCATTASMMPTCSTLLHRL